MSALNNNASIDDLPFQIIAEICRSAAREGVTHPGVKNSSDQQSQKFTVTNIEALPVLASVCKTWKKAIYGNPFVFFSFSSSVITTNSPTPREALEDAVFKRLKALPDLIKDKDKVVDFLRNLMAQKSFISFSDYSMALELLACKPDFPQTDWQEIPQALQAKKLAMIDPVISALGGLLVQNGCKFDITCNSSELIGLGIAAFHKGVKYSACFEQPPTKALEISPVELFCKFYTLRTTVSRIIAINIFPVDPNDFVSKYYSLFCPPEIQREYLNPASAAELFGIIEDFAIFHGCEKLLDVPLNQKNNDDLDLMKALNMTSPMSLREYAATLFPKTTLSLCNRNE